VFPRDAQLVHDSLASDDKRLEMIQGDHYLLEPADARDKVADIIASWLAEKA
jgi:esterase/lipase